MVVRRSKRLRTGPGENALPNNTVSRKRAVSSEPPKPKRRRVLQENSQNMKREPPKNRVTHCAIKDVVSAVLSDSPLSKYSDLSDDEQEKDLDRAKKNLFDSEVRTPSKTVPKSESSPPRSAGKFFKNRTPQKSKVLAAKSKSISLIRQTCLGQKLKVKANKPKPKMKKPVKKYSPLHSKNDCTLPVSRKSMGMSDSKASTAFEISTDDGISISDGNSFEESVEGSLASGPVYSPILPHSLPRKKLEPVSTHPDSPGNKSGNISAISLHEPKPLSTSSGEILAGSILTRSSGSSPALSTRSQKLKLFSSQEGELIVKGLKSVGNQKSLANEDSDVERSATKKSISKPDANSNKAESSRKEVRSAKQKTDQKNDQNNKSSKKNTSSGTSSQESTSSGESIIPSSQKTPQEKISEILRDFMADDPPSPQKTRVAKLKSPKKQFTPLKSNEVILYSPCEDSPKTRIVADKRQHGLEQTALDFGQKDLGTTQCRTCRMIYNQKDPEDEKSHVSFHQRLLTALKFKGWKSERIAQQFGDGSRIIIVLPEDKAVQKKVSQIQLFVDKDLGFLEVDERPKYMKQTYLYISANKRVEGYCVAEAITSAYPVLTDAERSQSEKGQQKAWCCSTEPVIAKCGISRVWVFSDARRQGIATKLLDCVRFRFFMGASLEKMDVAFTDPTPLGRAFATSYTGTEKFLVYK